ncbi:MAG: sugar ABC transporter permease, partial [Chloroflexota bacterium]
MATAELHPRSAFAGTPRGIPRALLVSVPLGAFVVVTLFPFYWMFITSIKSNSELYNLNAPQFLVTQPTLEHYLYLLGQTKFFKWAANTLLIALASTAISLLCGILA